MSVPVEKRLADEQLVPEERRTGAAPAFSGPLPLTAPDIQKERLLREFMQRFSALVSEKEAAVESLRLMKLQLETAIKASLLAILINGTTSLGLDRNSMTRRLLAVEGQIVTARKAQHKAESCLRASNSQLMSVHARVALASNREVAVRKELDAKIMEVAARTECPICYSLVNVPGHQPYRLGCPEGHVLCYECVYRMFLEPEKPGRGCPLCRHVLHRPPFLDRIFKGIADAVLPAHVTSIEDVSTNAPASDNWVKRLCWPPTAANARDIRRALRNDASVNDVIVIEDSSSDESMIEVQS